MTRATTFIGSVIFVLLAFSACTTVHTSTSTQTAPQEQISNEPPIEPSATEVTKTLSYSIEPAVKAKAKVLFEAVIRNDDKKAKFSYGRTVRTLPEIVQLAMDLRFKNYDHASSILAKTPLSDEQKDFWGKILAKKPEKLNLAICQELTTSENFPSLGSKAPDEEVVWLKFFDDVAKDLISSEGASHEVSELNKKFATVNCNDKDCMPIADDLRDDLLSDKFFDDIHNMRRRDSHFFAANFKSPLKLGQYHPLVSDMGLLKFYKALKATPSIKQMHFLRRFKSIARDMRPDTILSRSIGDIILGDDQDLITAKRFGTFLTSNSLISAVTRIENQIPSCQIK
jgi:hypothetical protein